MRIDYKVSKLGINQLIPIQSIVFAISLFDQQIQETRNFNKLSPTSYMLFSNRIYPPLAIFYLLLCMIPQTCTIAKPRNLCNGSCTLILLVWRRTRGSTISSWHRASASSFSFFFGRHTIELSTFLIRFTAQKIILRSCGAMASAASTTRP